MAPLPFPFHIGALCLEKTVFKQGLLPGTADTFYPNFPPWEWRSSINSSVAGSGRVGQGAVLRVLLVSEKFLPFHLEMLPAYYSISTLLAAKLLLFHPHQNQDERVSPYILFFPYIFHRIIES